MKTLIAGFGNVLLQDDGFGVEVVRRLEGRRLPGEVTIIEVGIGGMSLVWALMEGFERLIVVDTAHLGKLPGTVEVFCPTLDDLEQGNTSFLDAHLTEPLTAMRLAHRLGYLPSEIQVVSCEPALMDLGTHLTETVGRSVDTAVKRIFGLLDCRVA